MKLVLLLTLLFSASSYAKNWADPFVNPIKIKEERLLKLKEAKSKLNFGKKQKKFNLFKPTVPKPLDELSIQGVLGLKGKYLLVVSDPETGETFILKEGDAVSPSEKIVRIFPDKIVIVRFFYRKGKLNKSYKTLKVNSEG